MTPSLGVGSKSGSGTPYRWCVGSVCVRAIGRHFCSGCEVEEVEGQHEGCDLCRIHFPNRSKNVKDMVMIHCQPEC